MRMVKMQQETLTLEEAVQKFLMEKQMVQYYKRKALKALKIKGKCLNIWLVT